MAQLTIDLSPALEAKLRTRIDEAGYASPQEYLCDLIAADTLGLDATVPSHFSPKTRAELDEMVLEGLNSGPAVEITATNWAELRQRLQERQSNRNAR